MIYAYARLENDQPVEYPIYEGDLKARVGYIDNLDTQFEVPEGYVIVYDKPRPDVVLGYDEVLRDMTPDNQDGKWVRNWTVVKMTEEELNFKNKATSEEARKKRNILLVETDWTQLRDSPVDPLLWVDYRQALRDITKQETFPWEIEWPQKPNT